MKIRSESRKIVRLRDRLRGETQAAILSAAEEVFAAEGDGARMEAIAARAGVAVGTLYNYFQDRDALLQALVGARRAALLARLDSALAEGEARSFEEALGAFVHCLFEHWAAHRGLLAVLFQAERLGSIRGRGAITDAVTQRAETVLRRGRAEGKLRPDDARLQPALLVGMVWGALVQDAMHGNGAPGSADRVAEIFLRGAGS